MAPLTDSLSTFIEDIRSRWGISAISVSLIDGRSQGFGKPSSGPMTPNTVSPIASNTKLFTSVAIGILVEQGKLSFDSKIKDLIPGFKLSNPHTVEHVTVADALSHSTGGASGNIAFAFRYDDSPKDIVDHIGQTRCDKELNETFAYDNRWYSIAAYIIQQVSGQTYADFVKTHILEPLGMNSSTFNSIDAEPNAVTPTITLDDAKTTVDLPFWYANAKPGNSWEAAAGLFSTSNDMAKWLAYLIRTAQNKPKPDDPEIISSEILNEVIRPRIVSDLQLWFCNVKRGVSAYPEFSAPLYALGVERHQLHGIDIATHGGCMAGCSSVTIWTPDHDFGIAVVANQVQRGNAVICLIALRAFEQHFGIPPIDWESRIREWPHNITTGPGKIPTWRRPDDPFFPVEELKGTFLAPGYVPLHLVGIDDTEGVPKHVLHMRETLLAQEIFGGLAGDIKLMAIWDTLDLYLFACFILHHVGGNVFLAESMQLFPARGGKKGVMVSSSISWWGKQFFYAFKDDDGKVKIEYSGTGSFKDEVPDVGLGEGDFTLTQVQRLGSA